MRGLQIAALAVAAFSGGCGAENPAAKSANESAAGSLVSIRVPNMT